MKISHRLVLLLVFTLGALFALGGTKEQEAEYGRLKGEYEAIQQAAIAKKCTLPTLPPVEAANTAAAQATPDGSPQGTTP